MIDDMSQAGREGPHVAQSVSVLARGKPAKTERAVIVSFVGDFHPRQTEVGAKLFEHHFAALFRLSATASSSQTASAFQRSCIRRFKKEGAVVNWFQTAAQPDANSFQPYIQTENNRTHVERIVLPVVGRVTAGQLMNDVILG